MEAGKPYIFKATGANPTFTMKGDAVSAPVATTGLVGTFTEITAPPGTNYFVLNGNKLYNVDYDGVTVAENRAYIDITAVPTSSVKGSVTLELIGYDPTAIRPQTSDLRPQTSAYDLTGREIVNGQWSKVKGQKGVYIISGKKVIVK